MRTEKRQIAFKTLGGFVENGNGGYYQRPSLDRKQLLLNLELVLGSGRGPHTREKLLGILGGYPVKRIGKTNEFMITVDADKALEISRRMRVIYTRFTNVRLVPKQRR